MGVDGLLRYSTIVVLGRMVSLLAFILPAELNLYRQNG